MLTKSVKIPNPFLWFMHLPRIFAASSFASFQTLTLFVLSLLWLMQLLDLFIQWDWSTYLADYGQPTCKYLRVNPTTALILLEK